KKIMRTKLVLLVAIAETTMSVVLMVAQSQVPVPKFDAASLRPCERRKRGGRGEPGSTMLASSPGRLNMDCMPVRLLVFEACLRDPKSRFPFILPIEGPSWIHSDG